ncbi:MAG: DUF433 domain-containing protein [Armatimonadetes bacterium]|nr:DUF433 domain-containing protein [Armatimonadota bacterium]
METVVEGIGSDQYVYVPLGRHVVRAQGVCGGRPTFKYTRVEVAGTLERLASGEPLDAILAGYGGRVPREAIREAIDLALERFLGALPEFVSA